MRSLGQSDDPRVPPDPDADSLKPPPRRGLPWVAVALSLAAMWLTFFVAWPLGLLLAAPLFFYLFRRRRRLSVLCLLLSPYLVLSALSLILGVVGYFAGTARLRYFGMPSREFFNLDPRWRVFRSTSGCIVDGSEIFTHEPNNAAVMLLVRTLGPMRGVYAGLYPSREEAAAQLQTAVPVPRAALLSGEAVASGQRLSLEAETVAELARIFPKGDLSAAVAGAGGELLLLTGHDERGEQHVALIDRRRGRFFAAYYALPAAPR